LIALTTLLLTAKKPRQKLLMATSKKRATVTLAGKFEGRVREGFEIEI